MNNFLSEDDDAIDFIEANFRVRNSKGELMDLHLEEFQKNFFKTGLLYGQTQPRIIEKSRKLGFSMLEMIEDIMLANIYDHVFIPYAATTEEQGSHTMRLGKQLIDDCRVNTFKTSNDASWTFEFPNGSLIQGFPGSSPKSVRGPNAFKGTLDEFAFNVFQDEMLAAYSPMFAQGGQLTLISTLNGVNNKYYEILSHAEERGFIRLTQPIFEPISAFDINRSIPDQIAEGKFKIVAPWIDVDKLESDRLMDKTLFLQEYCCVPAQESYAVFNKDDIDMAIDTGRGYETSVVTNRLLRDYTGDPILIGCDFALSTAMSADHSSYIVMRYRNGMAEIINMYDFRGMNTPDQLAMLRSLYNQYQPVTVLVEDNSFGKSIFEMLQQTMPVVMPFHTSSVSKPSIIRQMQEFLANKKLRVPEGTNEDDKLMTELWVGEMRMFSKISNKQGTNFTLEAALGHDDMVMATAITLEAVLQYMKLASPAISVGVPSDWGAANIKALRQTEPKHMTDKKERETFTRVIKPLHNQRRGGFSAGV